MREKHYTRASDIAIDPIYCGWISLVHREARLRVWSRAIYKDVGRSMSWTQQEAINMCTLIEQVIPAHGAHIALTGGSLYKTGPRKDADILFYRIRQRQRIDMQAMWEGLEKIGFVKLSGFGWCYKATYEGKPVDCFFPESARDENGDEIEYGADESAAKQNEFEALLEPEVVVLKDGTRSDEEILF